jgi:hypothetical protein
MHEPGRPQSPEGFNQVNHIESKGKTPNPDSRRARIFRKPCQRFKTIKYFREPATFDTRERAGVGFRHS